MIFFKLSGSTPGCILLLITFSWITTRRSGQSYVLAFDVTSCVKSSRGWVPPLESWGRPVGRVIPYLDLNRSTNSDRRRLLHPPPPPHHHHHHHHGWLQASPDPIPGGKEEETLDEAASVVESPSPDATSPATEDVGKPFIVPSPPPRRRRQQQHLERDYQWAQTALGTIALVLAVVPTPRTRSLHPEIHLATQWGMAMGYALAAALCGILAEATHHQRLSSDTYQRLNLGLIVWAALSQLAGLTARVEAALLLPVHSTLLTVLVTLLLTAWRGWTLRTAWIGWRCGWDPALTSATLEHVAFKKVVAPAGQQLRQGLQSTWTGLLRVQHRKKALTYRNFLCLILLGMFSNIMEANFHSRYQPQSARWATSLCLSALGRLGMIATMIYSLKDAAERDRLTGSTFIQLNGWVGVWAAAVGWGQAMARSSLGTIASLPPGGLLPKGVAISSTTLGGFQLRRGVEMFAFAMFFWIRAIKSLKEKEEKKRQDTNK